MKLCYIDFAVSGYATVEAILNGVDHAWAWFILCTAVSCIAWGLGWTEFKLDRERKRV